MGDYKKNSLTLKGAITLGTGVMIGTGIFALLGQVAELSGTLFPYIFLIGGVISAFSAYSYIKVSNAYPSSGGIAMILMKAYGRTTPTAAAAVLMVLSMVMNESLVARTFGAYTGRLFNAGMNSIWVPIFGVAFLIFVYYINAFGDKVIQKTSQVMAIVKIAGILLFALGALWAANSGIGENLTVTTDLADYSTISYIGAIALSLLAYKGFTSITNSGSEITHPHENVGRSILISLLICAIVYFIVAIAVNASLSIPAIVAAKDYSLAETAQSAFGTFGLYMIVALAIIAMVSGLVASLFVVSRLTAMLKKMNLIPYSHLGMDGSVQKHMMVYVVTGGIVLTVFFDLSRLASIGVILYLVMDILVQWGVFKNLRKELKASGVILMTALLLDAVVLAAFVWMKVNSDLFVVIISGIGIVLIFAVEKGFLLWQARKK